jgi:hypothetical protein
MTCRFPEALLQRSGMAPLREQLGSLRAQRQSPGKVFFFETRRKNL